MCVLVRSGEEKLLKKKKGGLMFDWVWTWVKHLCVCVCVFTNLSVAFRINRIDPEGTTYWGR